MSVETDTICLPPGDRGETIESINKPIVMCRTHIREFSANRIKDPFTGKWVNKREPDFQRILRHRNIVQEMCPSCERLMKKHEEI